MFSALRKLYVAILLIEGGTRKERYAGEILLNIYRRGQVCAYFDWYVGFRILLHRIAFVLK